MEMVITAAISLADGRQTARGGTGRQDGVELGKPGLKLGVCATVFTAMTETEHSHVLLLSELLACVYNHFHYLLYDTTTQT